MKTSTKILLGALAGAAAGITAGMLLAPDHGSNTRKKVSGQSGQIKEDLSNRVQQSVDRMNALTESAFQLINDYKQKLRKETQEGSIAGENQYNTF